MSNEQILALLLAERDKLNRAIEALDGPRLALSDLPERRSGKRHLHLWVGLSATWHYPAAKVQGGDFSSTAP
jgi:hypothetical protein